MRIGGLKKFSVIDYPGKTAAVIFTQGCNFRCPFCFNRELVLEEYYQPIIPEDEIFSFLKKREGQLEGVVVTGGEPTVHDDLPEFLRKIRRMSYLIKLDTNGSNPSMLKQIINEKLTDYVAMDIKAPLNKYDVLAGIPVDINNIKESTLTIMKSDIEHEFRTTAVKALLSPKDLKEISSFVGNDHRYMIQSFIPQENILDRNLLGKECYSDEEICSFQESLGHDPYVK